MAGDLYAPRAMAADATLPAIVMSHGWGGTKALLAGVASRLAAEGYLVLAFDYRGWDESDGKLVVQGDMPDRDADGIVTLRAREIQNVVDPIDQTVDIRRAFDFIEGEPNADLSRGSATGARFGLWALGFGLWLWALGFGLWALGFGLWALGFGRSADAIRKGPRPSKREARP